MEDRAYRNAVKRRDELKSELEEVERFLDLYRRYAGTEGEQASAESEQPFPQGLEQPVFNLARRSPPRHIVGQKVREIILAKGHPLTRGELLAALDNAHLSIAGNDPSKNLGTMLWRLRDKFVNIEGQGYWPKDVPNPDIGYEPTPD